MLSITVVPSNNLISILKLELILFEIKKLSSAVSTSYLNIELSNLISWSGKEI